jgi:simple sugar transport system ATP-binding protein
MLGAYEKSQIDLEELVRQLAGGKELDELQRELAAVKLTV